MRKTPTFLLLLATGFLLPACQEEAVPVPAAAPSPAPAPSPEVAAAVDAWDASGGPTAGTRLEVVPDPVSFCGDKRQVVEVRWDMEAADPAQLQLWVEDAAGRRKLWVATNEHADVRRSGNWTTQGMKFVALDAATGRVLNSATVSAASCPGD